MRSLVDILRTIAPNVSRKQFGQIVRALLTSPLLTDEELGEAIALTIGTAVFGEPVPYAPPVTESVIPHRDDEFSVLFRQQRRRGLIKVANLLGWRVAQVVDYVNEHPGYTIVSSHRTGKVYVEKQG